MDGAVLKIEPIFETPQMVTATESSVVPLFSDSVSCPSPPRALLTTTEVSGSVNSPNVDDSNDTDSFY